MKKRIISMAIVFVMLFSFAFAASANSAHVIDFTDKLTDSEMIELDSYALTIEQKYGWCVMFAIVDNAENFDTTYEYAEDIYNAQKDAENGVLIVDNIGDNVYSVYLAGDAKNVFSEEDEDAIWNAYNDADTYYGGIVDYYNAVDTVLGGDGISADPIITTAAADTDDTTAFERVERQLPLVVDNADLLTDAEENEFNEKFITFTEEYEMEIAFLTVTSLDGKTAQQFADDFYDANGYGYGENDNGFLLLYLPGEDGQRELYLTTHGDAIYKMSDDMINTMLLEMKDDIISGNYSAALDKYIAKATEYVKPGVHFIWLFVLILAGCVIALFVLNGMAAANKSVIRQADAKVYVRGGSLVLMNSNEVFKGTYVNKEEKVQENNNSGSSTHTSSSGRTHGGGGIKF